MEIQDILMKLNIAFPFPYIHPITKMEKSVYLEILPFNQKRENIPL